MSLSAVIKSIQDIMRKDAGVDGDAQRISQLAWMFFLKIFDDKEQEYELTYDDYRCPGPERLLWRNWAKDSEVDYMVSQNAIPPRKHLGGYLPYVFTEQGVAAVSAVVKSKKAAEISVLLMRAFVEMRKFIASNAGFFQRLDKVEQKQIATDEKFEQIFQALEGESFRHKQGIFFDGQMFDAYTFVSGLIRKAKRSIILIDNYVDDSVLTILSKRKKNVPAIIFTKTITRQLKLDVKIHNSQYPSIEINEMKNSHDRFLILDKELVYHIGASLKDLGKKWFAFSLIDKAAVKIMDRLNDIELKS